MIKFNPCGMVIDYLSCCYTVMTRPFKDSDLEVPFRYFPAFSSAKPLPFSHFLTSRIWLENHHEKYHLGEVDYNHYLHRDEPYRNSAYGQHWCGDPEVFLEGQHYDPDVEPTVYNQDGMPACCLIITPTNIGGEGTPHAVLILHPFYAGRIGGEGTPHALHAASVPVLGRAGGEGTPHAPHAASVPVLGRAGGEGTPHALHAAGQLYAAQGDGEGTPHAVRLFPILRLGQIGAEGTPHAQAGLVLVIPAQAGGEGTPHATTFTMNPIPAQGDSEGTPHGTPVYIPPQQGNAGGEGTPHGTPVYIPPQQGNAGGEGTPHGTPTYTPPAVVPGTTCATAGNISLATTYGATSGMLGQWWKLSGLTPGAVYHVTGTNLGGMAGATVNGEQGANCSSLSLIAFMPLGPPCWQWTQGASTNAWMKFFSPIGGPVAYTFRVDPGTC